MAQRPVYKYYKLSEEFVYLQLLASAQNVKLIPIHFNKNTVKIFNINILHRQQ